ncbi:helix-turn-helix transcriptional regulator [Nocardia sp. NBC_00565]|uniref:helix-turn-helix domain-containing protein n=1 Tax=Nocardia sp. NBC_00565 TaxID=2975993 RepID=UPI002E819EFC|nr:helix-turn-helix transcriptional regulator [Nocardia sp. NBC_00565]WUC07736.1 helix-turn-helix transcriptional regulator [Nocardia sp. NBC_00565]
MTLLREAIGDSLRRARLAQSRTLREVSTSARVSLGYLSEVERGRKEASSELLAAICAALDVPLSRVLWDVSTIMAGADALPAEAPAPTADVPESDRTAAAEPAAASDCSQVARDNTAEAAPEAATATMSVARPKIAEDTRIVIPAPRADMLVLVKSN